jgi:hypothetical protein
MAREYHEQMMAQAEASMEKAMSIENPDEQWRAIQNAKLEAITFNTDDAKLLSPDYNPDGPPEMKLSARAETNVAVHNTANAIAKRAFVDYLDQIAPLLEPEDKVIVVTSGGAAAIWDAAGEANATENPWVLEEARKRGFSTVFTFVDADPDEVWADPKRGVIERATKKGRMVTARLFAESYTYGAKNFAEFAKQHENDADVRIVYFDNARKTPEGKPDKPVKVASMPKSALSRTVKTILPKADNELEKLFRGGKVSASIYLGGANHKRIWKTAPRAFFERMRSIFERSFQ